MISVEHVLEVLLNKLDISKVTSSVSFALAKKLELVLLASMPR